MKTNFTLRSISKLKFCNESVVVKTYHKKSLLTLVLIMLMVPYLWAQTDADRAYIKNSTNVKALKELEAKFKKQDEKLFLKMAQQNAAPISKNKKGQQGVPYALDKNGNIIYAYDDNVNAAKTSRTDKIWQGGISGLNLTGAGIEIAVWESGYALPTHQEFGGRAANGGDGGSVSSHGSHTGGTMIASGVDANAKGMASEATIKNYTATSMASEAAAFATAGGILANNSNSPSGTGYDANARGMDEVCYNAPYYTHCKSAGNNGQNYGAIYANQLAKNFLVVGNCNDVLNYTGPSSVSMSSSSSAGPSNDWRIKPDITNNGTSVYSCNNTGDASYISKSGTSMSTPATCGTIALLQQHYKNTNSVYMRAAMAKALLINTADEIGANDGPDFLSGWGLVNAERAAQTITNNGDTAIMEDTTLNNGATYTKTVTSSGAPVALTIAWQDPAGTISSGTSPVLVNDLDIRITGNGTTYKPWVMVPNASFDNYSDPAQKGDNFRDNVEKIEANLPAGSYTITVTHKGTLTNGSQDFSLVVTGLSAGPPPPQYNLTATASNDGSITFSPEGGLYDSASVVTVTAVPNAGFAFDYWTGDLSGSVNPATIVMNGPKSVGAVYKIVPTFTLTTSVGSGQGTVTPASGSYNEGSTVTVEATPATGYAFTGWSGDLTGTDNPATIVMNGNKSISATFAESVCNTYCASAGASVTGEWISKVDIGSFTNTSNAKVYTNFTNLVIDMTKEQSYPVTLTTGYKGTQYDEYWKIWVDLNKNCVFDDPGELVFDSGSAVKPSATGTITIPASAITGITTMRISMKYNGASTPCENTIPYGEVEDYAVNIKASAPSDTEPPTVPTGLAASNVTKTSLILTWNVSTDNVGVTGYDVYRGAANIGTVTTTTMNITGLMPGNTYSYSIAAKDVAGNISAKSSEINVTMLANVAPTANANGPYSGNEGTAISFSSAGSTDSDGTIASYAWTFGDGGTSTEANPGHVYTTAGTYNVSLVVTDNDAAVSDSSKTTATIADVPNQAPVAVINGPYTGAVNSSVAFSSAGSNDPDGSITSYAWNFGDGATSTVAIPGHTYTAVGNYTVTLSVTDNEGVQSSVVNTTADITDIQCTYCASASASASEEWINKVGIGTFSNTSAGQVYTDFTAQVVNMTQGQAYTFTLTPGFSGSAYNEYWRIWVDLNKDCDFDDPGEMVFDAGSTSNTVVTGNITIPATAVTGVTRIRISMKYNAAPTQCENTFPYGEVEDYSVNISAIPVAPMAKNNEKSIEYNSTVKAYPNPISNGMINVEIKGEVALGDKIKVFNMGGMLLKSVKAKQGTQEISLEGLSGGTYLISAPVNGKVVNMKIIIQE